LDSYQEVNCDIRCFAGEVGKWNLPGWWLCSWSLRRRNFLRRAKLTGPDDFNVGLAELSQTEAVVSSLVLGYMFLGDRIERMVRGK
jgi:hypothetical protein